MRSALLLMLSGSLIFFPQQTDIWQHVSAKPDSIHLRTLTPNPKQLAIVRKALAARVQWSHVSDRRRVAGSLRTCLLKAPTTSAVSRLGTLISMTKREWRSTKVAM
jgi:hypothetical protein